MHIDIFTSYLDHLQTIFLSFLHQDRVIIITDVLQPQFSNWQPHNIFEPPPQLNTTVELWVCVDKHQAQQVLYILNVIYEL